MFVLSHNTQLVSHFGCQIGSPGIKSNRIEVIHLAERDQVPLASSQNEVIHLAERDQVPLASSHVGPVDLLDIFRTNKSDISKPTLLHEHFLVAKKKTGESITKICNEMMTIERQDNPSDFSPLLSNSPGSVFIFRLIL